MLTERKAQTALAAVALTVGELPTAWARSRLNTQGVSGNGLCFKATARGNGQDNCLDHTALHPAPRPGRAGWGDTQRDPKASRCQN